ncbi:MAG TPA: hypothetical protein VGF96_12645 [Terracidiphilus sp.]
MGLLGSAAHVVRAQDANRGDLNERVQNLTDAIVRTQSQLDQSQRQLDDLRRQLAALQHDMSRDISTAAAPAPAAPALAAPVPAASAPPAPSASSSSDSAAVAESKSTQLDEIRERQELDESQIATLDQVKVESESKFPVKITGLLLMNGFVNTGAVNVAATPSVAIAGGGSTGASVRQTVLGFDAHGPHLFGARSFADLRVDFDGSPQSGSSSTVYNANPTLLRLRTAHAALQWSSTEAFFSLDRPLFSPDTPTSLTAVAEPALAWSGNLWAWNPQFGAKQDLHLGDSHDLRVEAALVDVGDAPLTPPSLPTALTPAAAGTGEQSRWPGVETHISFLDSGSNEESGHLGVGGYFAPHHSSLGYNYDAWAATLDGRLLLPARLQLTGSFYRGLALGGLGGGAYKDFAYRLDPDGGVYYFKSLDDVGGWSELKEKFNQRVELNAAYGMDNVFAGELRRYAVPGNAYLNLARNRTYTGNVIFSPSAYLLFSLEYRHLESAPVVGLPAASNIIGLGAGYKF